MDKFLAHERVVSNLLEAGDLRKIFVLLIFFAASYETG